MILSCADSPNHRVCGSPSMPSYGSCRLGGQAGRPERGELPIVGELHGEVVVGGLDECLDLLKVVAALAADT